MAETPYPAIIERPLPDKFGRGMTWTPRWIHGLAEADWWHSMLGTLWGTDAFFRLISTLAATDYGIGGSLDGAYNGKIFRWINYFDRPNTAGWASGYSSQPDFDGDGAALIQKYGWRAVNGTGRSLEFSGMIDTPVTKEQWASGIHLSAAIHHREIKQGYEEFAWNMHHLEVAEKDCPFPRIYRYTLEYQAGIRSIMEHFETGRDMPDTVQIAGLTVPLPWDAVEIDPEGPIDRPIYVDFPGEEIIRFTRKGAVSRQWGSRESEIVRRYDAGTRLRLVGYYHGEEVSGSDKWGVIFSPGPSNGARIHESGLTEPFPDTLAIGPA
jgi:hypothetical protein